MPSISLITRAYDAEAPYIESFIEYYFSIGCDEIHICVPSGNPCEIIKSLITKYANVFIHDGRENANEEIKGVQNIAVKHIKTTHIIAVDVDEFLDVLDIKPLLTHDYIRLNWVIAPVLINPNTAKPGCIKGFHDGQRKFIIRTDLCERLNEHDCTLKRPVEQVLSPYPLIHYTSRSFNDLFLKCGWSQFKDYQTATSSDLYLGLEDCTKLPVKFKLAAIYQRIANANNAKFKCHYFINSEIEDLLVSQTPANDCLWDLRLSYENYSSRINLERLIANMKKNDEYLARGRIPHNILTKLSDETLIQTLNSSKWIASKDVYNKHQVSMLSRLALFFRK